MDYTFEFTINELLTTDFKPLWFKLKLISSSEKQAEFCEERVVIC